jgi:hypothetical protein
VSDQDFNFTPPPRREAKKAFEPPPWEQDQFEELARRKEAEKGVHEIAVGTTDELTAQAEAPMDSRESPQNEKEILAASPASETDNKQEISTEDQRIDAMLLGLRNEEPRFGTQMWKVALAAAAVLAAVGVVIVIWGIFAVAATSRTGPLGSLGGSILVMFGFVFVGIGGWIAFRTLRQQGVL